MRVEKSITYNWKLNPKKSSNESDEDNTKKAQFIENFLNSMYLALFEQKIENVKGWNQIRSEIIEDLNEVLKKIKLLLNNDGGEYSQDNFKFSGFQDNIDFENEKLKAFFILKSPQDEITLNFHKHIAAKSEVVDYFIEIANKKSIIEFEEMPIVLLKSKTENWKHQLYEWIGAHIIIKNEKIEVVLERFEFINLERKTKNVYIAWYNYFDKFASIPVKIIVQSKESDEKNEQISENKRNWLRSFLKSLIPVGCACAFLFVAVVMNSKGLLLKLKNIGTTTSTTGGWQNIPSQEYTLNSADYLQDDISNDFQDNVVAISMTEQLLAAEVLPKALAKFASLKKIAFLAPEKFLEESLEQKVDLSHEFEKWDSKYDEIFDNPVISEHNLNFLKWGVFDTIRYGKFKIANLKHEFMFKIERKNFQQPSQILINKFYESILKIFEKIFISRKNISNENVFVITSKVVIDILEQKSNVQFLKNLYFFSPDSFWIEEVELEDNFIRANIRHSLFFDPLIININFISDGISTIDENNE